MWIEDVPNKNGKITSYKYVDRFKNPLTGKKEPISLTFKDKKLKTQKEAPTLLQEKADKKFSEQNHLISDRSFTEVIDMYFKSVEGVVKDSYLSTMRPTSTTIKNDIGFISINKITPVIINNLLLKYSTKYAPGTVGNKISIINGALKFAFDYGYLSDNTILNSIKRPRSPRKSKKKKEWKYLTQEELEVIVNHFYKRGFPYLARIALILSGTGLRYGELISIDYEKDIDFKNNSIHITKTYNHGTKKFDSPKSGDSRIIFFNEEVSKIIKEQILFSKQLTLRRNLIRGNKVLFLSVYGNPYSIASFNRYLKEIKFEGKTLTSHIFRHTYITRMIENNVPTHLIAEQVGHSDTKMIEGVYGHFSDVMREQLSSAVSGITFFEASY